MILTNYHTHTYLCKHSTGTPADFVNEAQKKGFKEIGISDHCPYPENFSDTWQNIRMSVNEISQYKKDISEAKEKASIPVYYGFECEWDKDYSNWYKELKEKYGAQYLVLGSHWVTNGSQHIYCPIINDVKLLNKYINQTIEGMQTGIFKFLAHPDLFMKGYKEWDAQSKSCLKAILNAAVDLKMPIEINGLGIIREPNETSKGIRFQYPYDEFWEMVTETNATVICNADAHEPENLYRSLIEAHNYADKYKITPVEKLCIE